MIRKDLAFELCTSDPSAVSIAEKLGFNRIELCTAIQIGGLTPSAGLIKKCTLNNAIEIHVLLRHRAGGFNYQMTDLSIFLEDIEVINKCGGAGVVTGCLNSDQEINIEFCSIVAQHCQNQSLELTFHRAFDFVKDPIYAMEQLIDFGFKRILTSGRAKTAAEGIKTISKLVEKADGRIEIMAGSGIGVHNAVKIATTGVNALHFTANKSQEVVELGMGDHFIVDEEKMTAIPELFR